MINNLEDFMKILLFLTLLSSPLFYSFSAHALESNWQKAEYLEARLVSEKGAVGSEENLYFAMELRLAEGWHTYWRMPGDGGLPPELNWESSENVEDVEILWPAPKRYEDFGLQSFGYEGDMLFPLDIAVKEPGQAITLKIHADIMVCNDICIPQHAQLKLEVPQGDANNTANSANIQSTIDDLPHLEDHPGLKIENVVISQDAIVITTFIKRGYERADLFIEAPGDYITTKPVITPDEKEPRRAIMNVALPEYVEDVNAFIEGKTLRFTLIDGQDAIERSFTF